MEDTAIVDIRAKGNEEEAMVMACQQSFIAKGNPKPVREIATFGKMVRLYGIESVFQIISLVGASWVSSLRVGVLMEITQLNMISKFLANGTQIEVGSAATMRWAAMAAFEGALLAGGLYVGRSLQKQKQEEWVNWVALAVTIVGGGLSSFTLINGIDTLMNFIAWIFAAVSSVGAPLIVMFMASNTGFLWKEINGLQNRFDNEYDAKMTTWSNEFEKEYPYIAAQLFGEERRRKLGQFDGGGVPREPKPIQVKRNITGDVRNFLIENGLLPSQIGEGEQYRMKPSDIADRLGFEGKERDSIHTSLTRLRAEEKQDKFN